jgi:D-beta-D-heptose 7-phosphate kinase/D-beta-D-heptose 1-phosphate adenosyltransferase
MRSAGGRLLSWDQAADFAKGVQDSGGVVVFTNGVFDLLHPGHVRYLQQARRLGTTLIVGVNSDRSVRANKGDGRPITPEHERAEVLRALAAVDAVVLFDEDTPHAIISRLQPDVLVKGADWDPMTSSAATSLKPEAARSYASLSPPAIPRPS